MEYRRTGRSGLKLPAVSLGLWHNFGDDRPLETQRAILRRAFDLGVTHFDLANNYGPPPGSAELNFGKLMAQDFRPYRDELVISTKAGYLMHPGPVRRVGLPQVPALLAGRLAAADGPRLRRHLLLPPLRPGDPAGGDDGGARLRRAAGQGAVRGHLLLQRAAHRARRPALLREMGVPPLIHQPSYSMLNRWTEEDGLLDALEEEGMGCISFAPLAQGLLTDKYLQGVPEGSRASQGKSLDPGLLTDDVVRRLRGLDDIARRRGQSLAQLALRWVLRDPRMTSALIGASSVRQLEANVAALDGPDADRGRAARDRLVRGLRAGHQHLVAEQRELRPRSRVRPGSVVRT